MAYRTVNVLPETHERLKGYKVGDATYDDVVQALMAAVPAEQVRKRLLAQRGPVRFQRLPARS